MFLLWLIVGGCGDAPKDQTEIHQPTSWDGLCETSFHHSPSSAVDEVRIVGEFNDWNPSAHAMNEWTDGQWSTSIRLPPGPHSYRFVEYTEWIEDGASIEVCDPTADLAICDDSTFADQQWDQECTATSTDCDSMILVPQCNQPQIHIQNVCVVACEYVVVGLIHETLEILSCADTRNGQRICVYVIWLH